MRATFLALLLTVASASAATMDLTLNGILTNITVDRTISDSAISTATLNVGVGLLSYNISTGGTLLAYCFEPQQSAGSGTYTIDSTLLTVPLNIGGISAAKANALRLLLGQTSTPFGGATALQQAAMQVAIWEIIRETTSTYNVSGGNTTFANESTAGVLSQAQTWLAAVNSGTGTPISGLFGLTNATFQDIGGQIPEPSTFGMIGLSMVSLAFLARRRK